MKKNRFNRFYNRIISAMGMELLDKSQILFVVVNFVLWSGLSLASTFNGIFIFASNGSIYDLMLFGTWTFIAIVLSGPIVGKITEKTSTQFSFVIGCIIQIAYYMTLIIAREKISSYIVFAGILNGVTGIFRDSSLNAMLVQYSTNQMRASLLGAIATVKAAISLTIPFIGGVFLDWIGGMGGYIILFLISMTLVIMAMVLLLKLPKTNGKKEKGEPFSKSVLTIIKNKNLIKIYVGEFFRGIHEGGVANYVGVLITIIATNNTIIGFNSSIAAFLALVTSMYIPKILRLEKSKRMYITVSIIFSVIVLPIGFKLSIYTLIFGAACRAMLDCYTANSSAMIIYAVIDREIAEKRNRDGYVLMKEIVLCAGRCVPHAAFLFIPTEPQFIVTAMCILGVFMLISALAFGRAHINARK